MRLSVFIAKRYLFSKKKQNAINIISLISVVGVTIGTTALIVVISVFNGMDLILQQSTENFTPDIVITPVKGKYVEFDSAVYHSIKQNKDIAYYNNVVEEKALVEYNDKLMPVIVKGVDDRYAANTHFDENLTQGKFELQSGDIYKSVVGYGIAADLGIGLNFTTPLIFYYPNKEASSVNSALSTEYSYPSGFFLSQQEVDNKYVITNLAFAQKLFRIDNQVSKIELKLTEPHQIEKVKKQLQSDFGSRYKIADKFELNRSFYAMMKSEKLAVFLIMLFILLIASFNIVGSISMLILDKKEDLSIYKALGMTTGNIVSIFKTEGYLITGLGALAGLTIGLTVCLLQVHYGFITLGDGSYIIDAYPVELVFGDIALIMLTVLFIGFLASHFPVKYLVNKLVN